MLTLGVPNNFRRSLFSSLTRATVPENRLEPKTFLVGLVPDRVIPDFTFPDFMEPDSWQKNLRTFVGFDTCVTIIDVGVDNFEMSWLVYCVSQ